MADTAQILARLELHVTNREKVSLEGLMRILGERGWPVSVGFDPYRLEEQWVVRLSNNQRVTNDPLKTLAEWVLSIFQAEEEKNHAR